MHNNSIINSTVSQIIDRIYIRLVSDATWFHMFRPILKEKSSTVVCCLKSLLYFQNIKWYTYITVCTGMPEETAPDLDVFMLSHQIAYASLQMGSNLSNDSIGINHTSSSHTINHSFFNKVIGISAETRGTNDVVFIVV